MSSQSGHGPVLQACFHFDPALDFFLSREQRGRACQHACPVTASLKHMIEALGVPHTEVGLVLVNGEAASMERRLQEGDRVFVYPALVSDDESVLRFAADAHLGGLARLLRMAGFDTLFDNGWQDSDLVATALSQERVVLTRDRDLLKRRDVLRGCHLPSLDPEEQMRELALRYRLRERARPFSLCLNCNVLLGDVDGADVMERVPSRVRERHRRFMSCPSCRRIYWEGSHWQRMRARLADLLRLPHEQPSGAA